MVFDPIVSVGQMQRRCICRSIAVLLVLATGAAHANNQTVSITKPVTPPVMAQLPSAKPSTWFLTQDMPPPVPTKPNGLIAGLVNVITMLRPAMPREKTDREREASVTGLRANGLSALGAALAGAGAGTGLTVALARGKGIKIPVTFGPRLYSGGGGLSLSMKW